VQAQNLLLNKEENNFNFDLKRHLGMHAVTKEGQKEQTLERHGLNSKLSKNAKLSDPHTQVNRMSRVYGDFALDSGYAYEVQLSLGQFRSYIRLYFAAIEGKMFTFVFKYT
jgi:hypothetical protein